MFFIQEFHLMNMKRFLKRILCVHIKNFIFKVFSHIGLNISFSEFCSVNLIFFCYFRFSLVFVFLSGSAHFIKDFNILIKHSLIDWFILIFFSIFFSFIYIYSVSSSILFWSLENIKKNHKILFVLTSFCIILNFVK